MRIVSYIIIVFSSITIGLYYIWSVDEVQKFRIDKHISDDVYRLGFSYKPTLYNLAEYQANSLRMLNLGVSAMAILMAVAYLLGSRKINRLGRDIEVMEKELKIQELKTKLKNNV